MDAYLNHWKSFFHEATNFHIRNFFYFLIAISILFFIWEVVLPWRKNQKILRKDFWLDGFYMFFNMYIFPLIGFSFFSHLLERSLTSFVGNFGIESLVIINLKDWSFWAQLLLMFTVRDFVQWITHRVLHAVPFLWEFHKVHHSVEEMGFAAHLRYHWFENIFYAIMGYLPLAMLGFSITDLTILYFFTLFVGHFNHSNINVPLGPFKYILNNPQMHIWHHAKELPNKYGVNFGLSLSIWDYLFKTAYIPSSGRDVKLGFDNLEKFPSGFWGHLIYPFKK